MTQKQMETRILNLERQLLNLAIRDSKRVNEAESAIHNVGAEVATACQETSVSDVWDSTVTYEAGDYVLYENYLYRCLVNNYGVEPTDTRYWLETSLVKELNYLNQRKVDK